eukprot:g16084.t1
MFKRLHHNKAVSSAGALHALALQASASGSARALTHSVESSDHSADASEKEEDLEPLPVVFESKVDSAMTDLCHKFLELSRQINSVPQGNFKPVADSNEVVEVRHVQSGDHKQVEITLRTEVVVDDISRAKKEAMLSLEADVQRLRKTIATLEADSKALQEKIQVTEDEGQTELLGAQMTQMLVTLGKHKTNLKRLFGQREADVMLKTDKTSTRVLLQVDKTQSCTVKEKKKLSFDHACLVALGGEGQRGLECLSSVEQFETIDNAWQNKQSMSIERSGCAATVVGNNIYVMGGSDKHENELKSVEKYDMVAGTWELVAPMISSRFGLTCTVLDGSIYAIGGDSGESILGSVERYEVAKNKWSVVGNMHHRRICCAAAMLGGKIYIVGGEGRVGGPMAAVEYYDPKTDSWHQAQPMLTKRSGCCAVSTGKCMFVFGGNDGTARLNSVERYDEKEGKWKMMAHMSVARTQAAATIMDGYIYVAGGMDGEDNILDSMERYNPQTNFWDNLRTSPLSSERYAFSLVTGVSYSNGINKVIGQCVKNNTENLLNSGVALPSVSKVTGGLLTSSGCRPGPAPSDLDQPAGSGLPSPTLEPVGMNPAYQRVTELDHM